MGVNTITASGQRNILRNHFLERESLTTQNAKDILGVPHTAARGCELLTECTEIEYFGDGSAHRMANYTLKETGS